MDLVHTFIEYGAPVVNNGGGSGSGGHVVSNAAATTTIGSVGDFWTFIKVQFTGFIDLMKEFVVFVFQTDGSGSFLLWPFIILFAVMFVVMSFRFVSHLIKGVR